MPFLLKIKKSFIVLLILLFVQLLLISLQIPLGERPTLFEKAVLTVFSPIQHGIVSLFRGVGETWNRYFDLRGIEEENRKTQEKNFTLSRENEMLRLLMKKYQTEGELRSRFQEINRNILPARIVSWDFANPYDSCLINKGSLDGVEQNMFVLESSGFLVGKIIEPITLKQSRVQLITDSDSGVGVYIEGQQITGVLSGEGKQVCSLKYIKASDEENVRPGQKILTSGQDGIYPEGIEIGTISATVKTSSIFLEIEVEPFFDFHKLGKIVVIKLNAQRFF